MFFFNDTATTEIYTLSLHDALPICRDVNGIEITTNPQNTADGKPVFFNMGVHHAREWPSSEHTDRKSTRLNSSHANISYAVFCLKKKNTTISNPVTCIITTTEAYTD